MERRERNEFVRMIGRGAFIVIGKWNQIKKCTFCDSSYFHHIRFVGDERRGENVQAEYECWYCGKEYKDGWFWKKFKPHRGWLKKGEKNYIEYNMEVD